RAVRADRREHALRIHADAVVDEDRVDLPRAVVLGDGAEVRLLADEGHPRGAHDRRRRTKRTARRRRSESWYAESVSSARSRRAISVSRASRAWARASR